MSLWIRHQCFSRSDHQGNGASHQWLISMSNEGIGPFFLLCAPSLLFGKALANEHSYTTLDYSENATYKARSSFSKAGIEALMSC